MRAMVRGLSGVIAVIVSSASLGAQGFQATGTNPAGDGIHDASWNVACTKVGSAVEPNCPIVPSSPSAATIVTAAPAGWQNVPTADGAYYISPTASGSIWVGSPNEDPHYQYVFSTQFDVGSNVSAIDFTTFAFDNYWFGGTLNGHVISISPTPGDPNANNWTSLFHLTAADGLNAGGSNALYLTVQGNGRTDGILVDGYHESTVPEPGSMALLGTGLVGLLPMVRRRRK